MKIRTRYAPSPTGHLHVGGARTALFNYLFAKHNGGQFIVRIEDTDEQRNVDNGIKSQLDNLRWLGVEIDETVDQPGDFGPYRQTERLDIYKRYINILLEKNIAYKCFCTPEELDKERRAQNDKGIVSPKYSGKCRHLSNDEIELFNKKNIKPSIRIKVPEKDSFNWNDLVRAEISIEGKDVGDWIAIKSNGIPTYNFAVVIDDYLMKISHVLRGEEHISNTPKQIHLYKSFGWKLPLFGHMTIITNSEGKKLSKRDTSLKQFIEDYKRDGYSPKGIFNFLSLLGWSPGTEQEIFSKEEIINLFEETRLSKSPSMFDIDKMKWMSQQYFSAMTIDEATDYALVFLNKEFNAKNLKDDKWIKRLVALYKNGLTCGLDIVEYAKPFFSPFKMDNESEIFLRDNNCKQVIELFTNKFTDLKSINRDEFKLLIKEVGKAAKVKGKLLFMPIRIITTGMMHGPDLFDTIDLIGLSEVKKRLK